MRLRLSRPLKFAGPALVTGCLVAALRLPALSTETRVLALSGLVAAAALFAASCAYAAARGGYGRAIAMRYAIAPAFFAASAAGFLLLIEGAAFRYALVVATAFMLYAWFAYVDGMRGAPARFTPEGFVHLVRALRAVASFFFLAFCFGITVFMQVPVWIPALAVLAATSLVTWETLWHAKRSSREELPLIVALALVASQLYVGLSFLPTSAVVNAAVATTFLAFALHYAERVFDEAGSVKWLRRQFAMSGLLVVLVLATARWA